MLGTGPGIDVVVSFILQGCPVLPTSEAEGQPLVLAVGLLHLRAVSLQQDLLQKFRFSLNLTFSGCPYKAQCPQRAFVKLRNDAGCPF